MCVDVETDVAVHVRLWKWQRVDASRVEAAGQIKVGIYSSLDFSIDEDATGLL